MILIAGKKKQFVVAIGVIDGGNDIYYEIALTTPGLPPQVVQREERPAAQFLEVFEHMKAVGTEFGTPSGIDKLMMPETAFYRPHDTVTFRGPRDARATLVPLESLAPGLGFLFQEWKSGVYNGGVHMTVGEAGGRLDSSYGDYTADNTPALWKLLP